MAVKYLSVDRMCCTNGAIFGSTTGLARVLSLLDYIRRQHCSRFYCNCQPDSPRIELADFVAQNNYKQYERVEGSSFLRKICIFEIT